MENFEWRLAEQRREIGAKPVHMPESPRPREIRHGSGSRIGPEQSLIHLVQTPDLQVSQRANAQVIVKEFFEIRAAQPVAVQSSSS